MRYVIAITGASGAIYGIRLLQELKGEKYLVVSETARRIIPAETGYSYEDVCAMADHVLDDGDLFACIASGSFRYDAMIVAPCSESSVAKFACGIADTLISRAVSVCIKEGRKLVLMVRETPKSAIMLENELKLARLGVCILDANPGFYPKPSTVDDLVNIVVGRCLDQVGAEHSLYKRWERSDPAERYYGKDVEPVVERDDLRESLPRRHAAVLPEPELDPAGADAQVLRFQLHHDGCYGAVLDPDVGCAGIGGDGYRENSGIQRLRPR